jgi:hypothetical protein
LPIGFMSCIPASSRNKGTRLRSSNMPGIPILRVSLHPSPADQNGGNGFSASPVLCPTRPTSPRAVPFIPDVPMPSRSAAKNIQKCVITARHSWPVARSYLKGETDTIK